MRKLVVSYTGRSIGEYAQLNAQLRPVIALRSRCRMTLDGTPARFTATPSDGSTILLRSVSRMS